MKQIDVVIGKKVKYTNQKGHTNITLILTDAHMVASGQVVCELDGIFDEEGNLLSVPITELEQIAF